MKTPSQDDSDQSAGAFDRALRGLVGVSKAEMEAQERKQAAKKAHKRRKVTKKKPKG